MALRMGWLLAKAQTREGLNRFIHNHAASQTGKRRRRPLDTGGQEAKIRDIAPIVAAATSRRLSLPSVAGYENFS
jgi:hypothetical protein